MINRIQLSHHSVSMIFVCLFSSFISAIYCNFQFIGSQIMFGLAFLALNLKGTSGTCFACSLCSDHQAHFLIRPSLRLQIERQELCCASLLKCNRLKHHKKFIPVKQSFSSSTPLTFCTRQFLFGESILCIVEYLAAIKSTIH